MEYKVYRLYEGTEIIYIGQSTNIAERIKSHRYDKIFDSYDYCNLGTKNHMDCFEMYCILETQPKLNKGLMLNKATEWKEKYKGTSSIEWHKGNLKDGYTVNNIKSILRPYISEFTYKRYTSTDMVKKLLDTGERGDIIEFDCRSGYNIKVYSLAGKIVVRLKCESKSKTDKVRKSLSKCKEVDLVYSNATKEKDDIGLPFDFNWLFSGLHRFSPKMCKSIYDWVKGEFEFDNLEELRSMVSNNVKGMRPQILEAKKQGYLVKHTKKKYYYQLHFSNGAVVRYCFINKMFKFITPSYPEAVYSKGLYTGTSIARIWEIAKNHNPNYNMMTKLT